VSCAKTAEPIKMQFGMLSWVGSWNTYYTGLQMSRGEGALVGLSVRLKGIVKHMIFGVTLHYITLENI